MTKQAWMSILLAVMLLLGTAGAALAEAQSDDMDIFSYAQSLFDFEDLVYYPYLPTFLDPVNYFGYVSLTSGVKGDTHYAVYPCDSENDLALYRGYLEYWGYESAPMECELPGVAAWRMNSAGTAHEGRPLMQTVDVYYAAEQGIMAVTYSYLDAWIYDAWLAQPDWQTYDHFDPAYLPQMLWLREDLPVMVEEFFLADLLFVTAGEELSLYPYDAALLQMRDLHIRSIKEADLPLTQHVLYTEPDSPNNHSQMLCVRVSCESGVRADLLRSLRAALADADENDPQYADCTDVPMLLLTRSEEDPLIFTLAEEEAASDLWLVFPPSVYRDGDVMRLYLCLEDENNPWIGDLRDWQYVNFQVKPARPW